jgi:hypothetical protein
MKVHFATHLLPSIVFDRNNVTVLGQIRILQL